MLALRQRRSHDLAHIERATAAEQRLDFVLLRQEIVLRQRFGQLRRQDIGRPAVAFAHFRFERRLLLVVRKAPIEHVGRALGAEDLAGLRLVFEQAVQRARLGVCIPLSGFDLSWLGRRIARVRLQILPIRKLEREDSGCRIFSAELLPHGRRVFARNGRRIGLVILENVGADAVLLDLFGCDLAWPARTLARLLCLFLGDGAVERQIEQILLAVLARTQRRARYRRSQIDLIERLSAAAARTFERRDRAPIGRLLGVQGVRRGRDQIVGRQRGHAQLGGIRDIALFEDIGARSQTWKLRRVKFTRAQSRLIRLGLRLLLTLVKHIAADHVGSELRCVDLAGAQPGGWQWRLLLEDVGVGRTAFTSWRSLTRHWRQIARLRAAGRGRHGCLGARLLDCSVQQRDHVTCVERRLDRLLKPEPLHRLIALAWAGDDRDVRLQPTQRLHDMCTAGRCAFEIEQHDILRMRLQVFDGRVRSGERMHIECSGALECLLERHRESKLPVDDQDPYRHILTSSSGGLRARPHVLSSMPLRGS